MNIPNELAKLLTGWPKIDSIEQAFPFLTVDINGFPHAALLSRSELEIAPDHSTLLAIVASPRTRANLARDGQACLIAIGGTTAHYAKFSLTRSHLIEGVLACRLRVTEHKADSVGVELSPIGFQTTGDLARAEHWETSRRLLQNLAESD